MPGIVDEHVAALLADKKLRDLPPVLSDAIERVPDSGILIGLKKIDGAVDQAILECDDLGDRLLARIYRHFANSGDKEFWNRDSQKKYFLSLAGVSQAALRFFMKHGKPAKYCSQARAGLAVGLGTLAELSGNREEAGELISCGIEQGEAAVRGFSEDENTDEWFSALRVLLIAHFQRFQFVESVSEKCDLLARSAELAENALRLDPENLTSRNLAVLMTFQAISLREMSRFIEDDSEAENLLVRAIDIQDGALDMLNSKTDRSDWIEAQENIGNLRMILREVLDGGKARRCVSAAGMAYKAALGKISVFKDPTRWARVNFNLGSTLRVEAGMTLNDANAARMLKNAISAYGKAATFIRRENYPDDFPRLVDELADVNFQLAQLSKGRKSRVLLHRSIKIFEHEAGEFDIRRDPDQWLSYKFGLSRALRHLGERSSNDDLAMKNYRRSAENAEEALIAFDEAGHDLQKANIREFLGCVYFAMSRHASDEDSADDFLEKSIANFEDGIRNCEGEETAMREEMKNMATLLRRYRENKADEEVLDAASKMMDVMKLH